MIDQEKEMDYVIKRLGNVMSVAERMRDLSLRKIGDYTADDILEYVRCSLTTIKVDLRAIYRITPEEV